MGDSALGSAAVSASYNMFLQLMFRMLTFVLNAVVLRYISKDILGIVNVRLTLLYTTALFISREAFRRACLTKATDTKWPQMVNLLWASVPIGVFISGFLSYIWMYWLENPAPDLMQQYNLAVICFATSVIIEMLAEPLYNIAQVLLFVRLKVLVMGAALAVRCFLTVAMVIMYPDHALLSFAFAQVIHTVFYSAAYFIYFYIVIKSKSKSGDIPFKSISETFPTLSLKDGVFDWNLLLLTWSFFKQSFLKQILTEGERFVMTMFGVLSFGDQGVYDIVNNLGSLAARFIFLPLEDSAYLFFTQTLHRGKPAREQDKESMVLASSVLENLLKTVVLIGCIILVFGYGYSQLLLDIYGGELLSTGPGPGLLRWFCVYVLLIAINGITESFFFSTMNQQQVDRYNHKMVVFSLVFLLSSWYLTSQLGSVGFIHANCLNMVVRILHSVHYISKFYSDTTSRPLHGLIPSPFLLLALSFSFITTAASESYLCCCKGWSYRLLHIGVGAICFLFVLVTIYLKEAKLINFVKEQLRQRQKSKKME